ncbi:MAG: Gfo/Idh/MocA family protein [Paracoccaceae bacterium]
MSDHEHAYAPRRDTAAVIAAPDLPYAPPVPARRHRIGVIGTGGISGSHLAAYADAGWEVAAIWNRTRATAEAKAAEHCPGARVCDDWREMMSDGSVEVVDVTLHPEHRLPIVEAALEAGLHVLSQKPFVTDLADGERLVALARARGVKLAVNQNGRWAPHLAWMREAVAAGLIGDVLSVHTAVHWDHGWTAGTPFDAIEDLILYDFGVHWFDFLGSVAGDRLRSVFAATAQARGQVNRAPLMAQAIVRMEGGQASVTFDGATAVGPHDSTFIAGTAGSLRASGPDLGRQTVTLTTASGSARPDLRGHWLRDGFRGTMAELLCAIEQDREPLNGAEGNLRTLALAFAATRSARTGTQVAIGDARSLAGR